MRASRPLRPLNSEVITGGRLHAPPTAAILRITATGASQVRWRDDSVDADVDTGHILVAHQSVWYNGDPSKLRFFGDVTVTFYKVA
jgi:hypothetical protein